MRKFFIKVSIIILLTIFAMPCHANLITYGDFSAPATISTASEFNTTTGAPLDQWYANPTWVISTDSNPYAYHTDNSRVRLTQVIDASSLSFGDYYVDFNYIYQDGFTGEDRSAVYVLGVNSGDPNISRYPTSDDGFPPDTWDWDVLYSQALTPPLVTDWILFSDYFDNTFTVSTAYDYWALVFNSSAAIEFAPYHSEGALRAIDNVILNAVSEPSTLLLIGFGLLGLAGLRRKE